MVRRSSARAATRQPAPKKTRSGRVPRSWPERTQRELGPGYEDLYVTPEGAWRWVTLHRDASPFSRENDPYGASRPVVTPQLDDLAPDARAVRIGP